MKVKICGITSLDILRAAAEAGADFAGFVFYPASPRAIDRDKAAAISVRAPATLKRVGLFVDPDDHFLETIIKRVELDVIQLHGGETPARVAAIKKRWGRPVIKAVRVGDVADVAAAKPYDEVADWLLFDAKVAGQAGGTGQSFDWSLLKTYRGKKPWMLSGGLNAGNIKAALAVLKPDAVDVSSGVEDAPGVKNSIKIQEFVDAVRASR